MVHQLSLLTKNVGFFQMQYVWGVHIQGKKVQFEKRNSGN